MRASGTPALVDTGRLRALDGLRGVAALTVVVFHSIEIVRAQLTQFEVPYEVLTSTPLALLSAGKQAVWIFFVLSGLVITLPVLRRPDFDWISYYPRRLVRLYVPAVASLVLAALILLLVPRIAEPFSVEPYFAHFRQISVDVLDLARESLLMSSVSEYNGPLWSLFFEVLFSLLLPAFVAFAVIFRRFWPLTIAAALAIAFVARISLDYTAMYLPIFAIGVIVAVGLDGVRAFFTRINALPFGLRHAIWISGLLLAWAELLPHLWLPSAVTSHELWPSIQQVSWMLGATSLVLIAIGSRIVQTVLETRAVQWLGKISFSLYLIHVPVIGGLSLVISTWWLVLLLGVPVSLLVATGFYLLVERNSHRLARLVGQRTEQRLAARQTADVPE